MQILLGRIMSLSFLLSCLSPRLSANDLQVWEASKVELEFTTGCPSDTSSIRLLKINNRGDTLAEWRCREFSAQESKESSRSIVLRDERRIPIPDGFRPYDLNEDCQILGIDERSMNNPLIGVLSPESDQSYSFDSFMALKVPRQPLTDNATALNFHWLKYSDEGTIFLAAPVSDGRETYVRRFHPSGKLVGGARGKGEAFLLSNTEEIVFSNIRGGSEIVDSKTGKRKRFGSFVPLAHEGSKYFGNMILDDGSIATIWDSNSPRYFKAIDHFCNLSRCRSIIGKRHFYLLTTDGQVSVSDGDKDWQLAEILQGLRIIDAPQDSSQWRPRVADMNDSGTMALLLPDPRNLVRPLRGIILRPKNPL